MTSSISANDPVTVKLLEDVRACEICAEFLPLGPRPVLQMHGSAKILIAGQAPGSKVHKTGIPFDDPSGDRLRDWMGIDRATFYDETRIAILPMGFCYPGKGKSGDLPPRPECAATWRAKLLARMPDIQLTLVIGQYAQNWHLRDSAKASLTETVQAWQEYWPNVLPLPHPSPRNNIWLKRNAWFETQVLPALRARVERILSS
ncbi:uracil-DNA glycosylase family protein [Pseudomonas batumici]|uniref:uracil-DNA glycosylase family protein n=1 Tax=Pseudomonas batumici TaxID=226910 RepID=UPI0030D4B19B